jgi:hypothetical protein
MTYGVQLYGPMRGLPCVIWSAEKEPADTMTQGEFVNALEGFEVSQNLTPAKKHLLLVAAKNEGMTFDNVAPLIRLAKDAGWVCGAFLDSQELPAYASEFNYIVAVHSSKSDWLRYRCAGIVVLAGATLPKFDEKTLTIPKYLFRWPPEEASKVVRESPLSWLIQSV